MNNKFKYIHFLLLWLGFGVVIEIGLAVAMYNKYMPHLTDSRMNLIHGAWLLILPITTLFFVVSLLSDVYDWLSKTNNHAQIEQAVKARS